MLLKEDINRFKLMSSLDEDKFLESEEYKSLCESDKRRVLEIFSSKISSIERSFDEFAEDVMIQERIFDLGIDLNEDNYRRVKREIEKELKD